LWYIRRRIRYVLHYWCSVKARRGNYFCDDMTSKQEYEYHMTMHEV
jgi:hypothetical protein